MFAKVRGVYGKTLILLKMPSSPTFNQQFLEKYDMSMNQVLVLFVSLVPVLFCVSCATYYPPEGQDTSVIQVVSDDWGGAEWHVVGVDGQSRSLAARVSEPMKVKVTPGEHHMVFGLVPSPGYGRSYKEKIFVPSPGEYEFRIINLGYLGPLKKNGKTVHPIQTKLVKME